MITTASFRCDIFCRVVDHFGDAGVAWRLARQLVAEHGIETRLIVDELSALRKLVPTVDIRSNQQRLYGVDVVYWCEDMAALAPADLVIEAFGCELPLAYLTAMAHGSPPPVWLNLDYLSAEPWIDTHHLQPSPHPKLSLTKHFFFPGFSATSGGLIREHPIFVPQPAVSSLEPSPIQVLIFAYPNAPADELLTAIQQENTGAHVTAMQGDLSDKLKHWCGISAKKTPEGAPALEFTIKPFVAQEDFDALLTGHDVLFVRGEDSFVRAQWAEKPFVWHIYPQAEGAHWAKLDAFLDRYCDDLPPPAANAMRALWRAWNAADANAIAPAWRAFSAQLPGLKKHAQQWAKHLRNQPDLASNVLSFFQKTYKI